MQKFHEDFKSFWEKLSQSDARHILELEIADMGADEGIEVTLHVDHPNRIIYDFILAGPESLMLLTAGSPETEFFWKCLRKHVHNESIKQLYLTARCSSSLLLTAMSPRLMSNAEVRNVNFLRLVEDILDELTTREPRLSVDIIITYLNPRNHRFIDC